MCVFLTFFWEMIDRERYAVGAFERPNVSNISAYRSEVGGVFTFLPSRRLIRAAERVYVGDRGRIFSPNERFSLSAGGRKLKYVFPDEVFVDPHHRLEKKARNIVGIWN